MELRNELLASDITKVHYKLQIMKEALIEFDQLQAHDAKKGSIDSNTKENLGYLYKKECHLKKDGMRYLNRNSIQSGLILLNATTLV